MTKTQRRRLGVQCRICFLHSISSLMSLVRRRVVQADCSRRRQGRDYPSFCKRPRRHTWRPNSPFLLQAFYIPFSYYSYENQLVFPILHYSITPLLHYFSVTVFIKQPPPPPPPLLSLPSEFALCVPPFASCDWALSSPSASTEVST